MGKTFKAGNQDPRSGSTVGRARFGLCCPSGCWHILAVQIFIFLFFSLSLSLLPTAVVTLLTLFPTGSPPVRFSIRRCCVLRSWRLGFSDGRKRLASSCASFTLDRTGLQAHCSTTQVTDRIPTGTTCFSSSTTRSCWLPDCASVALFIYF